ncbi:MAG TPA: FAD-dependent oxidoreductase, partial [Acidimicrobiales bacterium]
MADVGIAGAGLAGPLLAVFLARRGHDVTLYERRPDPRVVGSGGRSINLALSARGIDALERVGLADVVLAHGLAMRGRMMHDRAGQLAFQAYSADGSKAINSISRHGLNALLLDAAAKEPGVILHFEARAVGLAPDTGQLDLEGTGGRHTADHEVVIGAD